MIILDTIEITKRLLLAIVIAGAIGFDREFKNRPAGLKTHIIVCLGATIIALIQDQITVNTLQVIKDNPSAVSVLRTDQARLIAQVVSGIGFLGAGTIIVTKQSVSGLTTAASLWTVACLGLAVGMGYYEIAIIGFVAIQVILSALKKIVIVAPVVKLEVSFINCEQTKKFINEYFCTNKIMIREISFDIRIQNNVNVYTYFYTIEMPRKGKKYVDLVEELSSNNNITKIKHQDI